MAEQNCTGPEPSRKRPRQPPRPAQSTTNSARKATRRPMQFVAESSVPWSRVPDDMYGPTFDRADALSWESTGRRKMLSSHATGGAPLPKLGCSLCELEPGNTMWPFHYHLGSHEAIFILQGVGTMRWGYPGNEMVPVAEGDFVAIPPGPGAAHQLTNTGTVTLRYLCMDSKSHPDVTVLPDSQKYGVVAAVPPRDGRAHHLHTAFFSVQDAKPFFDGEDDFGRSHQAGQAVASCENVYVLGGMKEVENEAMSHIPRPPHRLEPFRQLGERIERDRHRQEEARAETASDRP